MQRWRCSANKNRQFTFVLSASGSVVLSQRNQQLGNVLSVCVQAGCGDNLESAADSMVVLRKWESIPCAIHAYPCWPICQSNESWTTIQSLNFMFAGMGLTKDAFADKGNHVVEKKIGKREDHHSLGMKIQLRHGVRCLTPSTTVEPPVNFAPGVMTSLALHRTSHSTTGVSMWHVFARISHVSDICLPDHRGMRRDRFATPSGE